MGRQVRIEILNADVAGSRFVRQQREEYERLGYPKQSAFAKMVSAGTVKVPPPDDPEVSATGKFFWQLNDVRRRIFLNRYDSGMTEHQRASDASMSVRRLRIEIDRILTELSGYLKASTF